MNLRLKYLLIFSFIALGGVLFFGYTAFETTKKLSIENELRVMDSLLGSTLRQVAQTMQQGGNLAAIQEDVISKLPNGVMLFVQHSGRELISVLTPVDDKINLFEFIGDEGHHGQVVKGERLYTWLNKPIENTEYYITIIRPDTAARGFSYMRQMGVSFALASLVILWLCAWLSVYLAGLIEKLKKQKDSLEHKNLYDGLTGLPNRVLLLDRLQQVVYSGARTNKSHAVLHVDLNSFQTVNDSLGHENADSLLIEIGQQLKHLLRTSDTIARLGGDKFGLILYDVNRFGAEKVAEKVLNHLEQNVKVEGEPIYVSASIGVALYPDHSDVPAVLLRHANKATHEAKEIGTGYVVYSCEKNAEETELKLVGELKEAIDNGELELYFQPKYDLKTRQIVSAEALARWDHPTRGLLPPFRFIDLAERTGLMGRLTQWVLRKALLDSKQLQALDYDITISLNLSVQNLHDPKFVGQVKETVSELGCDPKNFILEITESAIVKNQAQVAATLSSLQEMGFSISIDDFGTGYSSFINLKKLPINEIKIDRSFVCNATEDAQDASIVQATIDIGQSFGYKVVAEGVEDEKTLFLLERLGCHYAQGFYFAKPMAMLRFKEWLSRHQVPLKKQAASS